MKASMKHRSIWPSVLFGSSALGLAVLGWSLELADLDDQALDISLHNTYYVVPALWPWYAFISLLLAFAVIYLVFSRRLDSRLSIGHFVLWVPLPLLCLFGSYRSAVEVSRTYTTNTAMEARGTIASMETVIGIVAIMFLLGAVLFLLNAGLGVIRSLKPTSEPTI